MRNITQLDRIETMLYAYCTGSGLTQWITGWVAGQNEGGMMVALYSEHGQYPACKVYSEQFYKLPDYLVAQIPEQAHELPKDRNAAQRVNRLMECHPFQIARFTYDNGEKAKWRLAGVLRIAKDAPAATAVPVPTPPPASQPSPAELAESFFRVNDRVEVMGSTGTKPGVVTGFSDDRSLVAVKVEGTIYRLAPDRLIPVALAA